MAEKHNLLEEAPTARDCFIVMPISDPDGYDAGHFQHVFDDILAPACEQANFRAVRADQVKETNLIHLDVLQRLLDSSMVLVDLSSRNPNVLFELGLRQAFDKPVVLVQEVGTPKIFDIAPLRFTEYRRARVYHEVIDDQKKIADAIRATETAFQKGGGVNSIVKILSLTRPATLPDVQEAKNDPTVQIIRAEINDLRSELRNIAEGAAPRTGFSPAMFEELVMLLARLTATLSADEGKDPTREQLASAKEYLNASERLLHHIWREGSPGLLGSDRMLLRRRDRLRKEEAVKRE